MIKLMPISDFLFLQFHCKNQIGLVFQVITKGGGIKSSVQRGGIIQARSKVIQSGQARKWVWSFKRCGLFKY